MAERGLTVDHTTIYRWVQRYAPEFLAVALFIPICGRIVRRKRK